MFYAHQADFSRGEISPLLGSRSNVDFWSQSLFRCRNFHVLTHGGLRRRSGTRFVAEAANSAQVARIFPFIFSETQSYVLVFNNGQIRFVANRGVVFSGGSPYQIAHPYTQASLARVSYAQFNDIGYLAHSGRQPRQLVRAGETSWSLNAMTFRDGPYLKAPETATTLTPAGRGSFTPLMTSNTAPSGTVTASNSSSNAYLAFDGVSSTNFNVADTSGWIQYERTAPGIADRYWVTAPDVLSLTEAMPAAWKLKGSNDGSTWVTLDVRNGETGWSAGETRFFEFENQTAYSYYRFEWTGTNGSGGNTYIAEIGINLAAASQSAFNLTASSVAGINDGAGFETTDVGRPIRLLGSDGVWRWAEIVSRTSATVVTIRLHGHALPGADPIAQWRMGAWSVFTGWPAVVDLFNERLMFARTNQQPVTVWGSKQGDFDDFGVSDPPVDTDGVSITLLSSNMNEIIALAADEDLQTFSAGQVRSIGPADVTLAFSATNITQRKGPTNGASYLRPLSIGNVTLYVGSGGTKIRELVLSEQNRYVAPELSLIGEHLFKERIVDWAFAEKPDPVIYAVTGDGLLVSVTYDREQRVVGFARHDVGGIIENVAVIPGIELGHDDVYMIVRRTIGGQTKRYIEVMERPFDGDIDAVEDAYFVDCGLSYSGSPITTVTGLAHLEGESVIALADGYVVKDLTVSGGQVTLPVAASKVHVGLAYRSRAITLPAAGPQQDGTLFGRRRTAIGFDVDVLHSGALEVGGYSPEWDATLYEQIFNTGDGLFGNAVQLKTGFIACQMDSSWTRGSAQVVMETDMPLPLLIRSVVLRLEGEP